MLRRIFTSISATLRSRQYFVTLIVAILAFLIQPITELIWDSLVDTPTEWYLLLLIVIAVPSLAWLGKLMHDDSETTLHAIQNSVTAKIDAISSDRDHTLSEIRELVRKLGTIDFVPGSPRHGGSERVFNQMSKHAQSAVAFDVVSYIHDVNTLIDPAIARSTSESGGLRDYYAALERRIAETKAGKSPFRYRRIFLYGPQNEPEALLHGRTELKEHLRTIKNLGAEPRLVAVKHYTGPAVMQTSYGIFYQEDPQTTENPSAIIVWEVDAFQFNEDTNQRGAYILGLASMYDVRGETTRHFMNFFDNLWHEQECVKFPDHLLND